MFRQINTYIVFRDKNTVNDILKLKAPNTTNE